jgi:hypothetical protein
MFKQSTIRDLLKKREICARVLYSLAVLGLISPSLALDFVGICNVCDVDRHRRSTLKRQILNPAVRIGLLAKEERCPIELGAGSYAMQPPLVKKEYTKEELKKISQRRKKPEPNELAVLFEKANVTGKSIWRAVISEDYRRYAAGRAGVRDGFRFVEDKVIPTWQFLATVGHLFSTCSVDEWAQSQIPRIHQNLEQLFAFYQVEKNVLKRLQALTEPAKIDEEVRLLIGFVLTDFGRVRTQSDSIYQ